MKQTFIGLRGWFVISKSWAQYEEGTGGTRLCSRCVAGPKTAVWVTGFHNCKASQTACFLWPWGSRVDVGSFMEFHRQQTWDFVLWPLEWGLPLFQTFYITDVIFCLAFYISWNFMWYPIIQIKGNEFSFRFSVHICMLKFYFLLHLLAFCSICSFNFAYVYAMKKSCILCKLCYDGF